MWLLSLWLAILLAIHSYHPPNYVYLLKSLQVLEKLKILLCLILRLHLLYEINFGVLHDYFDSCIYFLIFIIYSNSIKLFHYSNYYFINLEPCNWHQRPPIYFILFFLFKSGNKRRNITKEVHNTNGTYKKTRTSGRDNHFHAIILKEERIVFEEKI